MKIKKQSPKYWGAKISFDDVNGRRRSAVFFGFFPTLKIVLLMFGYKLHIGTAVRRLDQIMDEAERS